MVAGLSNKNQNLNIPISLGSNLIKRKILFWATSNNVGKYLGDNGGVTKTNKDGKAILRIKCPKSYNDGLPHVHFLIATSNGQQWISNIYTMIVTCKLNKKEMKIAVKNKTPLEALEDIEILRFLELGYEVQMLELVNNSFAVDVPDDIKKVEKVINAQFN